METTEKKENLETNEKSEAKKVRKISVPFLVSGILLAISWVLYVIYFIKVLPDAIKYNYLTWRFTFTALDFLATGMLAAFVILAAFNKKWIKRLYIVVFVCAAITIFGIVTSIMDYGLRKVDAYYLFRNVTLALAYIFLGLHSIRKSIAIVFACIFGTVSSAFALWFNIESVIGVIKSSGEVVMLLAYGILITMILGVIILIWSCCILHPKKADNKDVIRRNIPLCIILSIITCGVFLVFWVRSMTDDIAKMEGKEVNSSFETALCFLVPFYAIYWLYAKGKNTSELAKEADMSILYAVQGVFLLGLFAMALMQHQLHVAMGLFEKE